ncbi:MAG: tryptophan 2,3-dioxygenase family protein [Gemmatimonadota bacterium]|nr:tryptophan 2,3-dioxygenase family protein [Gemmatimonadota bacterium]
MSTPREISYPTYLKLDRLLDLQHPESKPEHPDELLFIVVHQASELWFKVILHEFDRLVDRLQAFDTEGALTVMQRINTLVDLVAHELSALDTLPPQRFMQFRGYLGTSSGSQSAQFRAIEATSGLRDAHFMAALKEHGPLPAPVARALERPTLQALFLALLAHERVTLEAIYTEPGHTLLQMLAEAFLAYEQGFARWRFLHVQLVERIIGPDTGGTGGTLGARYLQKTISQRFFPELWAVRARLYGR